MPVHSVQLIPARVNKVRGNGDLVLIIQHTSGLFGPAAHLEHYPTAILEHGVFHFARILFFF